MTSLRQRMLEDMQIRNFSLNTQRSYLQQVSLFARHFRRSPDGLGPENIRAYQLYLTNEKNLAPSSILIATSALRFLYTVTMKRPWDVEEVLPMPMKPQTLPVILSPEEVRRFLSCVLRRKARTALTVCYATGLRVSEAIALKPTDIDSQRMTIRVTQGKGQKDRDVMLSEQLLTILRDWYRFARPTEWLFPGVIPGSHITRSYLRDFSGSPPERRQRMPHLGPSQGSLAELAAVAAPQRAQALDCSARITPALEFGTRSAALSVLAITISLATGPRRQWTHPHPTGFNHRKIARPI